MKIDPFVWKQRRYKLMAPLFLRRGSKITNLVKLPTVFHRGNPLATRTVLIDLRLLLYRQITFDK